MTRSVWFIAMALTGCSSTLHALHPTPRPVLSPELGAFACDFTSVPDVQRPNGRLTVEDYQTTLANGCRVASRRHLVPLGTPGSSTLIFDRAEIVSQRTSYGSAYVLDVRARWVNPQGEVVNELYGRITPPLSYRPNMRTWVEQAVAMMYEQLFTRLDQSVSNQDEDQ